MSLPVDLARELVRAYLPLERALTSGYELRVLLRDMGWYLDLSAVTDQAVDDLLGAGGIDSLTAAVETIVDTVEDPQSADLVELAQAIEDLHDAVAALAEVDPTAAFPGGSPGMLATAQFWIDLAADLPEYLVIRWLRSHHPVLHGLLRLIGAIEDRYRAGLPGEQVQPYEGLVLERLGDLLAGTALSTTYDWGGSFDHGRLLEALLTLAERLGLGAVLRPIPDSLVGPGRPWGANHAALDQARAIDVDVVEIVDAGRTAEAGLVVAPVPHPGPSAPVGAVLATVRASGALSTTFDLIPDTLRLIVAATADASGSAGVVLSPDGLGSHGSAATADLSVCSRAPCSA